MVKINLNYSPILAKTNGNRPYGGVVCSFRDVFGASIWEMN